MHIRKLLCVAALVAAATPALAGDFYVYGALGSTQIGGESAEAELKALGYTNISDTQDTRSTGYKLHLGYQINPSFAVEAGYVDLGDFSESLTATNLVAHGNVGGYGLSISGVGTVPLNESTGVLFRLGMVHTKVTSDVSLRNTATGASLTERATAKDWNPLFGVGLQYKMAKNVDLRFEVEQCNRPANPYCPASASAFHRCGNNSPIRLFG